MDKIRASTCLPVYKLLKNPCFNSVLTLVCKLQTSIYVAMTKEFTTIFLMNLPFPLTCFGKKTIPWWMHKFMVANTMSKELTLYASTFKSYDG